MALATSLLHRPQDARELCEFSPLKETQLGDIKSTLDLIMERTRGMTLSSDERADLKKKSWASGPKALG